MHEQKNIRVNWFMVIIALCQRGYTVTAIGAAIGMSKSTVLNWKQGAEPRHHDGEKMISLWRQATGLGSDDLPRISRYDYRA